MDYCSGNFFEPEKEDDLCNGNFFDSTATVESVSTCTNHAQYPVKSIVPEGCGLREIKSFKLPRGRPPSSPVSSTDSKEVKKTKERNGRRRARYVERQDEQALFVEWKQAVNANHMDQADVLQCRILQTKAGRQLFPSASNAASDLQSASKLMDNVKVLNHDLGQRSKHRRAIVVRVTEGLPASFVSSRLGVAPSYVRQSRKRSHDDRMEEPAALYADSRSERGRVSKRQRTRSDA